MKTIRETLNQVLEEMNKNPEQFNRGSKTMYYGYGRDNVFSAVNRYLDENFKLDTEGKYQIFTWNENATSKTTKIKISFIFTYPNGETKGLEFHITLEVSMGKSKLNPKDTEFRKIGLYIDNIDLDRTASELFQIMRDNEMKYETEKLERAIQKKDVAILKLKELITKISNEEITEKSGEPIDWELKDALRDIKQIGTLRERLNPSETIELEEAN